MPLKKYFSKHSVLSSTSEFDRLKKTQKSEMRMISTAAYKLRNKFARIKEPIQWQEETEASNVKMYETHFPGFCYLKDGKYRKKVMNVTNAIVADPVENSEKIRSLLFTGDEIDIKKVLCLHILGTHVQNSKHIQRKDGRFCSFVKSQYQCSRHQTLQSAIQKMSSYERDIPSTYDKMLPRYILEVRNMSRIFSNLSLQTRDTDTCSDDETVKKKRMQVPIYINNDIRAIVYSIIEALEMASSPKLKDLINLAASPEELRNLLSQEEMQEFIKELASNELITRASAYDFVLTQPVFDKIPKTGTMETVAQILEITVDSGLKYLIHMTRKMIFKRHEQLVECNVLQGKKRRVQSSKTNASWNRSITSSSIGERSTKISCSAAEKFSHLENFLSHFTPSKEGKSGKKFSFQSLKSASFSERFGTPLPQHGMQKNEENLSFEMGSLEDKNESRQQNERFQENDVSKYDLKSLSNSQRILLGLKVANMKSRPINMHQFENNKNIDISSLISSIVRPKISDSSYSETCSEEATRGLDQNNQRISMMNGINNNQIQVLGNLTKKMLFNFRHEISTAENKKRVREFLNKQL